MGKKEEGDIVAFLSKGTKFEGKLTFEGVIRLDGFFAGEIKTDGTLILGESAHIEAHIEVGTIIVNGLVKGDIKAKDKIEIHAPGKVYGNLFTPKLMIQEGVIFEGKCSMESEEDKRKREDGISLVSSVTKSLEKEANDSKKQKPWQNLGNMVAISMS